MLENNNFIFKVLHIVAWIIFVGLCIEAGALIVNFIYSVFKPEIIKNLYQNLDLSKVYRQSKWVYYSMYSFLMAISLLKAMLFYMVIVLLDKLDLSKPFNNFVSKKITQISNYTFYIGILSLIAKEAAKNLTNHGYDIEKLNGFWIDSQAFILMAAVVYVIATIFKKGVALQDENDLTV